MDTTLSETTPLEADHGPKICFNPYLEERFSYGTVSNCIHCHKRAVYDPKNPAAKERQGYNLGATARCSVKGQGNLSKCVDADPGYFDGVLRTDFVWTIPGAQPSSGKSPGGVPK